MQMFYTTTEGGTWHLLNLMKRKEINSLLKSNCRSVWMVTHGIKAIKLKSITYDFLLHKHIKTHIRPNKQINFKELEGIKHAHTRN